MTRLLLAVLLLQVALQTPPATPTPGNASPTAPLVPDPAAATFSTDLGLLLVAVKQDRIADYEAVIVALQEALAKSDDADVRTLASGWRVYKASDLDAKANALYVHLLQPTVPGVDYRPSLWLDKLVSSAPAGLLAKYRDAFAASPTKLPLVEFANMAVAPVPKPANGSPGGPTPPVKPGNQTTPSPPPITRIRLGLSADYADYADFY